MSQFAQRQEQLIFLRECPGFIIIHAFPVLLIGFVIAVLIVLIVR